MTARVGRRLLPALVVVALALTGCSDPNGADSADGAADARRPSAAGTTAGPSGFVTCPQPTGPAPAGSPFADLVLPCMDGTGDDVALGEPTGRPRVVTLWAVWCEPCWKEMPAFVRLDARAAGRVDVIGVDTKDSASRAAQAGKDLGIRFPVVYDRDQRALRALRLVSLPATVFLDAGGRVVHVYHGVALDDATLGRLVEKHLKVVLG